MLLQQLQLSRFISSFRCCASSQLVEEDGNKMARKWSQVQHLLHRRWLIEQPNTRVSKVLVYPVARGGGSGLLGKVGFSLQDPVQELEQNNDGLCFHVIRDDLLHPLLGGNKLRKLDALLPQLEDYGATDVVTCGGCQSAHTAALAFACTERGIAAHLLLRGEKPTVPTGYNLLSSMYGHTTYVPRSQYADRLTMFKTHASRIAGISDSIMWLDESVDVLGGWWSSDKRIVVVKEGAGDAVALLGLIRLVHYLSQPSTFGNLDHIHIVVDSGTGTTAVGLALGIWLLGLPWKVTGVMLADSVEGYEGHKVQLVSGFCKQYSLCLAEELQLPLSWIERQNPRKFGNILPGEVSTCKLVAKQTGILLDPIYTLAGWETATRLSLGIENKDESREKVVMLHTGGTLGLFGLAQRYPTEFR